MFESRFEIKRLTGKKNAGFVDVICKNPDATIRVPVKAIGNPHLFKQAARAAGLNPRGRLFDKTHRFAPQTKGEEAKIWAALLEGKK